VAEEEDVVWEWNKLFTEVVSIITANKEAESAADETLGVGDEEITNVKSDTISDSRPSRRERELAF
jgi:hypothetical protein